MFMRACLKIRIESSNVYSVYSWIVLHMVHHELWLDVAVFVD